MARTTGLSSRAKSTILYGFAVPLSVGFLVAFIISMVHVEKAQADARAKLVQAYDESVDAWLAGDGETYARKWTGEQALPLPSVSLEREDPERPQSSVAFDVLQSGPEAIGSLRDDEPDYKRYDEGTMLVAIFEGFHDESFHTGVEDVVFTVGETSVPVKAMTCVVNEYCNYGTEEDAEDSDSDESGAGSPSRTRFCSRCASSTSRATPTRSSASRREPRRARWSTTKITAPVIGSPAATPRYRSARSRPRRSSLRMCVATCGFRFGRRATPS